MSSPWIARILLTVIGVQVGICTAFLAEEWRPLKEREETAFRRIVDARSPGGHILDASHPTDRSRVMRYLEQQRARGEVVTGLLYINAELPEMHKIYRTSETPMKDLEFEELNPGSEALAKLQAGMR